MNIIKLHLSNRWQPFFKSITKQIFAQKTFILYQCSNMKLILSILYVKITFYTNRWQSYTKILQTVIFAKYV